MITLRPTMVHVGVTQLKDGGDTNPKRQPKDTHKGNAEDKTLPNHSIQSLKLLPSVALYPSVALEN